MNAWSRGSVLKCFVDFKIEDISKAVASIFSKKKKKKKKKKQSLMIFWDK